MSEFRVVPSSLDGAAGRLSTSAARMEEARAALSATSGAGAATGDGGAASAFSSMLSTWNSELSLIGNYTRGVGLAAGVAGQLYEAVDNALFNVGGGSE